MISIIVLVVLSSLVIILCLYLALCPIVAAMLSSQISQEEERNGNGTP